MYCTSNVCIVTRRDDQLSDIIVLWQSGVMYYLSDPVTSPTVTTYCVNSLIPKPSILESLNNKDKLHLEKEKRKAERIKKIPLLSLSSGSPKKI